MDVVTVRMQATIKMMRIFIVATKSVQSFLVSLFHWVHPEATIRLLLLQMS